MRGPVDLASVQRRLNLFVELSITFAGEEGVRGLKTFPQAQSHVSVSVLELLPPPDGLETACPTGI